MSDAIYKSVFDRLKRAIVHTSTSRENGFATLAGLNPPVVDAENLGDRCGTVELMHASAAFRTEALRLARRAIGSI